MQPAADYLRQGRFGYLLVWMVTFDLFTDAVRAMWSQNSQILTGRNTF